MSNRTITKKVIRWLTDAGCVIESGSKHLKIYDSKGKFIGILPKNFVGSRSAGNSWHVFRQDLWKNGHLYMPPEITKG